MIISTDTGKGGSGSRTTLGVPWSGTLALLFLFALATRLVFLGVFGSGQALYDGLPDQAQYLDLAAGLMNGEGYRVSTDTFAATAHTPTAVRPPLYPIVLAGIFAVFDGAYLPVRIFQAVLGAGTCLLLALAGARCFGATTGLISGFLLAAYPAFIMYVRPLMPEMLYISLVVGAVVCLLFLDKEDAGQWALPAGSGFCIGMASLTRPEGLAVGALLLAWLTCLSPLRKAIRLRAVLIFCGCFVACLVPWVVRNQISMGSPLLLPTHGGFNLWEQSWLTNQRIRLNWDEPAYPERHVIVGWQSMTEMQRDNAMFSQAIDFIRHNPAAYVEIRLRQVWNSFPLWPKEMASDYRNRAIRARCPDLDQTALVDVPNYVTIPEVIRVWCFRLLFVGFLASVAPNLKANSRPTLLLLSLIGLNAFMAFFINALERYRMQVDPFMIILAANGLVLLYDRKRTKPGPRARNASANEPSLPT